MKRFLILVFALLGALTGPSAHAQQRQFALGADISWVTELESRGLVFTNAAGQPRECTALMQELGLSAVRLRVWVNPKGFCHVADVVAKARRAARLGLDVMIDFHYSDSWADPGQQHVPQAWLGHNVEELCADVERHTTDVLRALREQGLEPRWVQVGNETTNGLLWPQGHSDHPDHYAAIIAAGCGAVKRVFPKAQTVVHLDNGFDGELYCRNLGALLSRGVDFDVVGMSLYPDAALQWHPDKVRSATDAIRKCAATMRFVADSLHKPCIIAETGMKVTRPHHGRRLLNRVIKTALAQESCQGVFYWEPEAPLGYNGGYDMGAFTMTGDSTCAPTAIMDAFTACRRRLTAKSAASTAK